MKDFGLKGIHLKVKNDEHSYIMHSYSVVHMHSTYVIIFIGARDFTNFYLLKGISS